MRLNNFVLDALATSEVTGSDFKVDSIAASAREIDADIYPFKGDMHVAFGTKPLAFQAAFQRSGSCHVNCMLAKGGIINVHGSMKMTGSMSGKGDDGIYKWGILMAAPSTAEG
jgi:hypothetical protein